MRGIPVWRPARVRAQRLWLLAKLDPLFIGLPLLASCLLLVAVCYFTALRVDDGISVNGWHSWWWVYGWPLPWLGFSQYLGQNTDELHFTGFNPFVPLAAILLALSAPFVLARLLGMVKRPKRLLPDESSDADRYRFWMWTFFAIAASALLGAALGLMETQSSGRIETAWAGPWAWDTSKPHLGFKVTGGLWTAWITFPLPSSWLSYNIRTLVGGAVGGWVAWQWQTRHKRRQMTKVATDSGQHLLASRERERRERPEF